MLNLFASYDLPLVERFIAAGHSVEIRKDRNGNRKVRIDGGGETSVGPAMAKIERWIERSNAAAHIAA
jgi:hypothetical protein